MKLSISISIDNPTRPYGEETVIQETRTVTIQSSDILDVLSKTENVVEDVISEVRAQAGYINSMDRAKQTHSESE